LKGGEKGVNGEGGGEKKKKKRGWSDELKKNGGGVTGAIKQRRKKDPCPYIERKGKSYTWPEQGWDEIIPSVIKRGGGA